MRWRYHPKAMSWTTVGSPEWFEDFLGIKTSGFPMSVVLETVLGDALRNSEIGEG